MHNSDEHRKGALLKFPKISGHSIGGWALWLICGGKMWSWQMRSPKQGPSGCLWCGSHAFCSCVSFEWFEQPLLHFLVKVGTQLACPLLTMAVSLDHCFQLPNKFLYSIVFSFLCTGPLSPNGLGIVVQPPFVHVIWDISANVSPQRFLIQGMRLVWSYSPAVNTNMWDHHRGCLGRNSEGERLPIPQRLFSAGFAFSDQFPNPHGFATESIHFLQVTSSPSFWNTDYRLNNTNRDSCVQIQSP